MFHFIPLLILAFSGAASAAMPLEPPVVRLSMETEPMTLDWHANQSPTDRFIISFLMRGLLKYEASAKPACDLCKKYSVSTDGKVYRFEIRDEVKWSDGSHLDAQQFVDSFRRLLDPENAFKAAEDFKIIEGAIQTAPKWDPRKLGVRTQGTEILEITLSKPLGYFPDLLTMVAAFPIRKELIRPRDKRGENLAREAILGPYQLAEWARGKRIVIEGNPKYTDTRPVYRVEFIVGSRSSQVERFKAGKIDILSNPTTEDLLRLPDQKIQVNPYWATRNLIFNFQKKAMKDLSLRNAVLYALDREALPAYLRNGERRVTGLIPPGLAGFRELALVSTDQARAQSERNHATPWPKVVEVDLLVRAAGADEKVAHWLTEQLDKIKIKVNTRIKPDPVFFSELEKGHFDLALTTAGFDIANPTDLLRTFTGSSPGNRGKWAHLAYDTLVEQMLAESNPAELARKVDQATQLIEVQEVAAIPLGYPTQPFLLGPRVQRFTVTPFGDPDLVNIELKR